MAKRERDPNAKSMYYSDGKTRMTVIVNFVAASTQKEGTWFADILYDGRQRYLQLDNDEDRKTLQALELPATVDIKNFGNIDHPALMIWHGGRRIDGHGGGVVEAPSMDALAKVYVKAAETAARMVEQGYESELTISLADATHWLAWAYVHTRWGTTTGTPPRRPAEPPHGTV